MEQYQVRSGQNIYDIALSLYGNIEGVFDLLVSNPSINVNSKLQYGDVLNYHKDFVINENITNWLKGNNVLVKNGERYFDVPNIEKLVAEYYQENPDKNIYGDQKMSQDEIALYNEAISSPRMVIRQQGNISEIKFKLKPNTLLIIDWGDITKVNVISSDKENNISHYYKGSGDHIITLFGNFDFELLDLRGVNGTYYPLSQICADTFISSIETSNINQLIITK